MLHRLRQVFTDVGGIESTNSAIISYLRIQPSNKSRQDGQGNQIFANWKIYFEPNVDLIHTDSISYQGKQYSILGFYLVQDKDGNPNHLEVTI